MLSRLLSIQTASASTATISRTEDTMRDNRNYAPPTLAVTTTGYYIRRGLYIASEMFRTRKEAEDALLNAGDYYPPNRRPADRKKLLT